MSKGIGFGLGKMFYFKKIDLENLGLPAKIGIDWGVLNWNFCLADNASTEDIFWSATYFVGMKVGPVVSYSPLDNLFHPRDFFI